MIRCNHHRLLNLQTLDTSARTTCSYKTFTMLNTPIMEPASHGTINAEKKVPQAERQLSANGQPSSDSQTASE